MDLRLAEKITGKAPSRCQTGHIYGEIYEITDLTEPNGIFRYPAITLESKNQKIIALLVQYELGDSARSFWSKLIDYEGEMYRYVKTEFFDSDGSISRGFIATIKNKEALETNLNAIRIDPHDEPYLFLKKCII